jgi:glycerol-3-phosphate dehydrogenase
MGHGRYILKPTAVTEFHRTAMTQQRRDLWAYTDGATFDVAILGGGVNGACLYHSLCLAGYRVLLLDERDFAAGSSQASGMMVWGGMLYMRNFDFLSVYQFSRARDAMLRALPDRVAPLPIRFVPLPGDGRSRRFVELGLQLYWLLGHCRRRFPQFERDFAEAPMVRDGSLRGALRYEEGTLSASDCRFALEWITPHREPDHVALNYCTVTEGDYNTRDRLWNLTLRDNLRGLIAETRARWVVNCTGAWVDKINEMFAIETPYKHVLSKGVYVGLRRPAGHESTLVFETGYQGDVVTLAPWGPVSLLGPTESRVVTLDEGLSVSPEDVQSLIAQAGRHLVERPRRADVVSLRCGIRALAVPRAFDSDCYTLDLSRRHRVVVDGYRPWISLFGGKLTGCIEAAASIKSRIVPTLPARHQPARASSDRPPVVERQAFPRLAQPQPSVRWCMEHEFCHTLEDYLRRRTNISQWVAREGLGPGDENISAIQDIAIALNHGDAKQAELDVNSYRAQVRHRHDPIVEQI